MNYRWRLACLTTGIVLLGCGSAPRSPNATGTDSTAVSRKSDDGDTLYEKAKIFDRFLRGDLELSDRKTFLEACHQTPPDNPFCAGVLLQELTPRPVDPQPSPSVEPVPAHFQASHLTNWYELRHADIPALVKGFEILGAGQLEHVRYFATHEDRCPNNAAIAMAAVLEERLPHRISLGELARLYERGGACPLDSSEDQYMALTRSGLFYFAAGKYRQAAKLFARASAIDDVKKARALYWLYRTRARLGDISGSQEAATRLETEYPFSFHLLVALSARNRDPGERLLQANPLHPIRSRRALSVNPLIEQVEQLRRMSFAQSASKVLDWAITEAQSEEAEPEVKVYLAALKTDDGDESSRIALLSDVLSNHPALISRQTMELFFPKAFFPIFEKHSNGLGLDPYLLLAIARRESAFNPLAQSRANAQGLLQLTPETTRALNGDPEDLMDPEYNVKVGAKYFAELLRRTNGQIHLALAAYNAGPRKVQVWTNRYPTDDPILFIDLLPFRETREYVASVMRNYYWYRRLHDGKFSFDFAAMSN